MSKAPLMPMATAVWLVENTSLTFKQIANFCNLHEILHRKCQLFLRSMWSFFNYPTFEHEMYYVNDWNVIMAFIGQLP